MNLTLLKNWKTVRLGDLVSKVIDNRGKTPAVVGSGFELLEVNAITEKSRFPEYNLVKKFVDEETYNSWFRTGHIQKGDIIIPTVGTIGNVAISLRDRGSIAQNLIALRFKDQNDSLFLYYILKSPMFKKQIFNLDIGGVQPSVKVPHLLDSEIKIPELIEEQKEIANIFGSLDDKIELLRKENDILENIAQELFKEWFVNFRFPNSKFKMIDSELGKIPEGWKIKIVNDVTLTVTKGTTPTTIGGKFTESGINFIKAESITEQHGFNLNKFSFIDEYTNSLLNRSIVQENDILYTIAGTIGRFALITKDLIPANTNQAVAIIRANKEIIDPYYLRCYFDLELTRESLVGSIVEAVQANLSLGSIKDCKILLPNNIGMEFFKENIKPLFIKKDLCNLEIQTLSKLRDGLLNKIFT